MALVKVIGTGDEIQFDLTQMAAGASKKISVSLVERTGRAVVLKISADRSIPIKHFKQQKIEGQ